MFRDLIRASKEIAQRRQFPWSQVSSIKIRNHERYKLSRVLRKQCKPTFRLRIKCPEKSCFIKTFYKETYFLRVSSKGKYEKLTKKDQVIEKSMPH